MQDVSRGTSLPVGISICPGDLFHVEHSNPADAPLTMLFHVERFLVLEESTLIPSKSRMFHVKHSWMASYVAIVSRGTVLLRVASVQRHVTSQATG